MRAVDQILDQIHAQTIYYQCFRESCFIAHTESVASALTCVEHYGTILNKKLQASLAEGYLTCYPRPHQTMQDVVRRENPQIVSTRLVVKKVEHFETVELIISLYVYFE